MLMYPPLPAGTGQRRQWNGRPPRGTQETPKNRAQADLNGLPTGKEVNPVPLSGCTMLCYKHITSFWKFRPLFF